MDKGVALGVMGLCCHVDVAMPMSPSDAQGLGSPLSPKSPLSLSSSLMYNPSQTYWDVPTLPRQALAVALTLCLLVVTVYL